LRLETQVRGNFDHSLAYAASLPRRPPGS